MNCQNLLTTHSHFQPGGGRADLLSDTCVACVPMEKRDEQHLTGGHFPTDNRWSVVWLSLSSRTSHHPNPLVPSTVGLPAAPPVIGAVVGLFWLSSWSALFLMTFNLSFKAQGSAFLPKFTSGPAPPPRALFPGGVTHPSGRGLPRVTGPKRLAPGPYPTGKWQNLQWF